VTTGVFLVGPCRGTEVPRSTLVEFGASSECSGFASARSLVLRDRPLRKGTGPILSLRVRLSWSSCSHEHVYVGCPSSAVCFLSVTHVGRELPHSRRCRPQGSCPSRRFRLARGSLRGLLDPVVRRGPRRFAAFFHAARVPGASLQSFPFPRSRTRSRGPFLPCEFAFDCRRRSARGSFTIAFPDSRASSLPSNPPESGPGTHEPGRRFLAIASPVASARKRAARTVPIPLTLGSPVSGRHARFEALLPPGVRSATIPLTWPGWNRPSVLSWDSRPPEFSPPRFGIRSVAQPHAGDARSLCRVRLRAPSHRGCIPRPGLRRLDSRAQDPSIREVDRTRVSPSGGDPAH
jgi:hypothetical protein